MTNLKQHILRALVLGIEHEEKLAVEAVKAKQPDPAIAHAKRARMLKVAQKRINAQPMEAA